MATPLLPTLQVAVVGQSRDDTTYLLTEFERWSKTDEVRTRANPGKTFVAMEGFQLVNDFGPRIGAPVRWRIQGPKRSYAIAECVEGFESLLTSARRMPTVAILVLSAKESVVPSTAEFLQLLRVLRCREVIVYVSETSLVTERDMLDLVEIEAREALSAQGFEGDSCTVLFEYDNNPEAIKETFLRLCDALDSVPIPEAIMEDRFVLSVSDVFRLQKRGLVCAGSVHSGTIAPEQPIEVINTIARRACTVAAIDRPRFAPRYDNDEMTLELKDLGEFRPGVGDLITSPGATTLGISLKIQAYVFERERQADRAFVRYGETGRFRLGLGRSSIEVEYATDTLETDGATTHYTLDAALLATSPVVLGVHYRLATETRSLGIAVVTQVRE